MSISSIGGGSAITNSAAVSRKQPDNDGDNDGRGGKVSDMVSKLDQLSTQNPAQFAKVTADMASQFRDAARSATGDDAKRLNGLADGLTQASKSGNTSSLKGKRGHHGGHRTGGAPSPTRASAPDPRSLTTDAAAAQVPARAAAQVAAPAPSAGSSVVLEKAIDELDKALTSAATPAR